MSHAARIGLRVDLLTRRYPCGLPGPFRTVRDLGRVLVGCSWKSGWRPLLRFSEFGALPLWTRSLIPRMAKIIPRIFRVMDASAVTARALQGMARVRSGQAPAWPLVLTGVSAVVSRVKRDFACPFTWHFSPVPAVLQSRSR